MGASRNLWVKSRAPSFWRAGIQFTRAGVEIDTGSIDPDQLAAILAEPALVVTDQAPASGSDGPGSDVTGQDAGGAAASKPAAKQTAKGSPKKARD